MQLPESTSPDNHVLRVQNVGQQHITAQHVTVTVCDNFSPPTTQKCQNRTAKLNRVVQVQERWRSWLVKKRTVIAKEVNVNRKSHWIDVLVHMKISGQNPCDGL